MTQEEKLLLLKDLSARLLYEVVLKIGDHSDYKLIGIVITDENPIKVVVVENGIPYKIEVPPDIIKPYLRPMSSMTEEERDEYHSIQSDIWKPCGTQYYDNWHSIDWLNTHHFDYRGLIEKGLAISTEEFNPYEE